MAPLFHFWHKWQPAQVFDSFYEEEGWAVSIVGMQCACGERKLETKREASVAATQKAYNWLHFKEYLDDPKPQDTVPERSKTDQH